MNVLNKKFLDRALESALATPDLVLRLALVFAEIAVEGILFLWGAAVAVVLGACCVAAGLFCAPGEQERLGFWLRRKVVTAIGK